MLPCFGPADVDIINDEAAYNGFFKLRRISLRHRLFEGGWSDTYVRELCVRGDAVGVLLYDPHLQKLALVEQFRVGVIGRPQSPWLLELVAGMLDREDEGAEALARRETLEEAGLEVETLVPISRYFCSPGGSTEFFSVLCGKVNLSGVQSSVHGLVEEHENIRLHILPVAEVMSMLADGQVNNAMTIIALQWLQLNKAWLDEKWR